MFAHDGVATPAGSNWLDVALFFAVHLAHVVDVSPLSLLGQISGVDDNRSLAFLGRL